MRRETLTIKVVDGCEIRADVYRPKDDAVRPVIIWLHGGALIFGSRSKLDSRQRDLYLRAGFAVAAVDYRLAPETKLDGIAADLRDSLDWARGAGARRFGFDPERLAVVGHSAGGYLTLLSGCLGRPTPRALVSFYGYGDIVGRWYSEPDPFYCRQPAVPEAEARAAVGGPAIAEAPGEVDERRRRFYLYCRQRGLWPSEVVGHDPATESAAFVPYCPLRQVTPAYPPTLLLHGDEDTDVPYKQSTLMAGELARAGVEHELVTIPGGPHVFDGAMDDPVVARAFDRVLAFLRAHV